MGSRVFAAAAAALSLSVGVASAGVSPARLVSSALAKAHGQRSVHYLVSDTFSGVTVMIAGDAATDRGTQEITYRKGGRVGHATVLVVANTAYVQGDAFTLTNYMGIPASSAAAWAGRWLSLAQSAPDFTNVAAAVRLPSTLDELKMPPPFRRGGTLTRAGRHLVGVESRFRRAGQAVRQTLYIDVAHSLPVEQIGRAGATSMRTMLSRWNEPVSVSPPASAIPIR